MSNGMKQQAAPSRKEKIKGLETEVQNMQMALRISQVLLQQLMQSMQNMTEDLNNTLGALNDLQYKVLAMQKVGKIDIAELAKTAEAMKLTDFEEAAAKQDAEEGLLPAITVTENSTVVITSTIDGKPDSGLFRSRLSLKDPNVKDLKDAVLGKQVGTKFKLKIGNNEHDVELLAIREPSAPQASATESNAGNA